MDFEAIERLRDHHAGWGLLRRDNAPLTLAFLGGFFVENNHGATAQTELASALDDLLDRLNAPDPEDPRFPRDAVAYLDDWAGEDAGWLRRFYPMGSDEVHYDATPAFEKAYTWVTSLQVQPFVGTESRLKTVIELLRQMVHGTQIDPEAQLAELHRRRDVIDQQIADVEAGKLHLLDSTAVRERYQQFASTARQLLSDFREVEENFRALDRSTREQMATWDGSKGELLTELVGTRSRIDDSDQGRSFQAFYDLLLSQTRQEELNLLLRQVSELDDVQADSRLRSVHHDWAQAAERTQHTVRLISEQLRRFLDDRVWVENRRVFDLVRRIEAKALSLRDDPPTAGLEIPDAGLPIVLPFERPLFDARPSTLLDSFLEPGEDADLDTDALLAQSFVDQARLAAQIRSVIPRRGSALLEELVELYPLEQGVAEIIGYLALSEEDIEVELDESQTARITFRNDDAEQVARLPRVTVSRP